MVVALGEPKFTNTTAYFDAKLLKPGDSVVYEVTVTNEGTINATLGTVVFLEQPDGSSAINYVTTSLKPSLSAGEETTFLVTAEYIKSVSTPPQMKTKTLTGIIEYVQE